LSDLLRFLEAKTKNTTAARAIVPIATPTPIPAFAPVFSVFDSEGSEVESGSPGVEPGDAVFEGRELCRRVGFAVKLILSFEASAEA
jgi:hypothetical protein